MNSELYRSLAFCLVAYKTESWTPLALESFRQYFPSDLLLVVDNNPSADVSCDVERTYLRNTKLATVIYPKNENDLSHGAGIDSAIEWCRSNSIKYVVPLEPDCLIKGRKWFQNLADSFIPGTVMVGSHRKIYGPIHPTPSIWDVSLIDGSFRQQPRGSDQTHPRFQELVKFDQLMTYCRENYTQDVINWFETYWDTGHKLWFDAAVKNKARVADAADDFIHYWNGSRTTAPD